MQNLGKDVDFAGYSVHTVSGVLKQFFIEPEESLLSEELYSSFMAAIGNKITCILLNMDHSCAK
jgi:hypothetical protein